MKYRPVLSIFLAGIWINLSEFFRNEWLLKEHWTEHFQSLGLEFPATPINGMIWGIWGFTYAALIYTLSQNLNFWRTTLWGWVAGFFMMWLVTANLLVLPLSILIYAVPLSALEAALAAKIIQLLKQP